MSSGTDLKRKYSRWRVVLTIITFIALLVLVYSLRHQILDVIKNLSRVNAAFLLLLIPIEVLNYDAYARLYRKLFEILGHKVRYWPLFRLTVELNFVNHILPSGGVSGISYFSIQARNLGISTAKSTLAQITRLFLLFVSFQPLLVFGLLALAVKGHVNNLIMVVATSLITLLIVGTFVGIYIIESRSRINSFLTFITKFVNGLIQLVRPRHPETINILAAQKSFDELHENYQIFKSKWRELKMPFIYTLIANITEIAALYVVYIAFGRLVNIGAVILAYAVANFAGLISVLPSGIGIYEALMTGVLAATGIPAELSIPVTVMYRVLNMFLQLAPGYYFYQKSLHRGVEP